MPRDGPMASEYRAESQKTHALGHLGGGNGLGGQGGQDRGGHPEAEAVDEAGQAGGRGRVGEIVADDGQPADEQSRPHQEERPEGQHQARGDHAHDDGGEHEEAEDPAYGGTRVAVALEIQGQGRQQDVEAQEDEYVEEDEGQKAPRPELGHAVDGLEVEGVGGLWAHRYLWAARMGRMEAADDRTDARPAWPVGNLIRDQGRCQARQWSKNQNLIWNPVI